MTAIVQRVTAPGALDESAARHVDLPRPIAFDATICIIGDRGRVM